MPLYSDLGLYSGTSSHTPLYLSGPYANHSSIIASNFSRLSPSYVKSSPRTFRSYIPHLSTISERRTDSPIRRLHSTNIVVHSVPSTFIKIPRPIKINTADIDVSINKYRKFERTPRTKPETPTPEKYPSENKTPSPSRSIESPRSSLEIKEAKPNKIIRRDRATVRLQTIHKDKVERTEVSSNKKWRDNFQPHELNPDELVKENVKPKKTPGELLKEKFLIPHKENMHSIEPSKIERRRSVKYKQSISKTPSFHDICTAITSETINEELNPGQPEEIQRRQSRQFSSENLLKHFRKNSSELTKENLKELESLHLDESETKETRVKGKNKLKNEDFDSRGSVRKKKKAGRTSSNESLTSDGETNKSNLQRKLTKKYKKTSSDSLKNDEKQKYMSNSKPMMSIGSEEKLSNLKAVIEDVEVAASPIKKSNNLSFSFSVDNIEECVHKNKNTCSTKIDRNLKNKLQIQQGEVQIPKSKKPVISTIVTPNHNGQFELKEMKMETIKIDSANFEESKEKLKGNKKLNCEILESTVKPVSSKNAKLETNFSKQIKENIHNRKKLEFDKKQLVNVSNNIKNVPIKLETKKVKQEIKKAILASKHVLTLKHLSEKALSSKVEIIISEPLKGIESQISPKCDTKIPNKLKTKEVISERQKDKNVKNKDRTFSKDTISTDFNNNSTFKSLVLQETEITVCNMVSQTINEDQKVQTLENFWVNHESVYKVQKAKLECKEMLCPLKLKNVDKDVDSTTNKKIVSKRSLIQKATKDDPDLEVFVTPEPEFEAETLKEEEEQKNVFIPLQSNRLSQWMHPFQKPEQFNVCPVEIFARPKTIRKRHYPKARHAQLALTTFSGDDGESESSEETESSESEESSDEEEFEVNVVYEPGKVGTSTSSNDSGFDSGVHRAGGLLQESRDSPSSNPAINPAFAIDQEEEYSQSSTYASFQRSGRITPPATTIPRFRKYAVEDFNFLKVLGKGSFGKVLLAELKDTEYYYAIKCLKKDVVLEDDDVECTLIERKVLALGTKHPYLCHLLCTFQTDSHLFFVMEYLNGGDLMFHIQQSGRFPETRARFYGAEIVSGLKFLHNKGIVYRDLKLDNILLDFDGHVRIADFGMCKLQIFLERMADTFCGTPDYMAPEIIRGQHYNQCVDWWSFGVLLYEMLLGQSPFSGCDEDELFWSICNEKPVLPKFLSTEASTILSLFLEKDANNRLGNRFCPSGEIMDQSFFRSINWDLLEYRMLEPPFKPNLQHPLDTKYFDKTFTTEKAKLTPIEQNILESMDQSQFQGFSYTNPNATDK